MSDTLWEEAENAAGDEEQLGKERRMCKVTKAEKPEEVRKKQPVW